MTYIMKTTKWLCALPLILTMNYSFAIDESCQPLIASLEENINATYKTNTDDGLGGYEYIYVGEKKYAGDSEGGWELLEVNANEDNQQLISDITDGTELKVENCNIEGSEEINGQDVKVLSFTLSFSMMGQVMSRNMKRYIGADNRVYLEEEEMMGKKMTTTYTYDGVQAPEIN